MLNSKKSVGQGGCSGGGCQEKVGDLYKEAGLVESDFPQQRVLEPDGLPGTGAFMKPGSIFSLHCFHSFLSF